MAHPTTSSAYGIWSLNEVRDAVRGENWPEIPRDPNFDNVSLLINADGLADGSTAFVDESNNNHTITANGDAQVDTAVVKYGSGSMQFDGAGDYLALPASDQFAFGTGDFTVEYWVNINSTDSQYHFTLGGNPPDGVSILHTSDNGMSMYYGAYRIQAGSLLSTGTWYHIALCRSSGSTKLFVDGAQVGSTYADSNDYGVANARIGSHPTLNSLQLSGYMDDLRITKGVARYTANFTPPTEAFLTQ